MFEGTIINTLENIWPMIIIFAVILSSIRITHILKTKEKFVLYQELLKLLFLVYIMALFYVVTFQDVSWSSSNFIPFKEMFRYKIFSSMFFRNVVGNMIMFMPYGFFVSYFLKLDKKRTVLILCLLVSCTIETTQFMIGRVFDVDDIMLNILGGLMGYTIYRFGSYIKNHLPNFLKNQLFYDILVLAILLCMFAYLYQILGVGLL